MVIVAILVGVSITLLCLGLLIGVHEFGHFYFAKRAGLYVTSFSLGMGPVLYATKIGETQFCIRLLPIGGSTAIAGLDEEHYELRELIRKHWGRTWIYRGISGFFTRVFGKLISMELKFKAWCKSTGKKFGIRIERRKKDSVEVNLRNESVQKDLILQNLPSSRLYTSSAVSKRLMLVAAGPVINLLLGVMFLFLSVMIGVPIYSTEVSSVGEVNEGMSTVFQVGDIIQSVNGYPVFTPSDYNAATELPLHDKTTIMVKRDGKQLRISVEDVHMLVCPEFKVLKRNLVNSFVYSIKLSLSSVLCVFHVLVMLFVGKLDLNLVGGPVAMATIASSASYAAIELNLPLREIALLGIAVLGVISINLGIMNLLPIPALDGGHIFFMLIEIVRGRPIDWKLQNTITYYVFMLLLLLSGVVLINDLRVYILPLVSWMRG